MSPELLAKVRAAAKELKISEHDTIRLAMRVGLTYLKRIDYKIDEVVVDSPQLQEPPAAYLTEQDLEDAMRGQIEKIKALLKQAAQDPKLRLHRDDESDADDTDPGRTMVMGA